MKELREESERMSSFEEVVAWIKDKPEEAATELRKLQTAYYEQGIAHADEVARLREALRDVRGWAETYEDWMGGDDFARRAEALARADALLAERT